MVFGVVGNDVYLFLINYDLDLRDGNSEVNRCIMVYKGSIKDNFCGNDADCVYLNVHF